MTRFRTTIAAVVSLLLTAAGLMFAPVAAQAGAPYSCTTSSATGGCPSSGAGYTSYAGMSNFSSYWNFGSPYVDADMWGPVTGETQTLSANSPGDWQAVVNIPSGSNPSGAVTTYPDAGMQFGEPSLTTFGDITSSLADTVPQGAADVGWQGYDNWFNSWGDEIMIQTNYIHQSPCTFAAVQQFGGTNGVPVQTWGLCDFGGAGGEKVWQLAQSGAVVGGENNYSVMETSGSVDISAMTAWLITHGYMLTSTVAATTLTALSAGFEVTETASGGSAWTYSNLTFENHTGSQSAPLATTNAATGVTSSAATLNGSVNPEGAATSYKFEYGTSTAYGTSVPAPDGSAGSSTTSVAESANLTGLTAGTIYHYRIDATNSGGTTLGADQSFTTSATAQAPTVVTNAASGISSSGATLNGTVNPNGQATTWQYQYGTTTSYGSVAPVTAGSAGSGTTAVSEPQAITGLAANTTYHYRLTGTNTTGTTNGSDQQFTTSAAGSTVAFGAVAPGSTGAKCANCTSLSWSATVSGTNPALLAEIAVGKVAGDGSCVVAATDNGVSIATAKLSTVHDNATNYGFHSVYGVKAPAAGTHALAFTVTGCGTPQELTGGSLTFTGASQTAPFGTAKTATGSSGTPSVTTTGSTSGDMVAGFASNGSQITSATSPSTSRFIANQDNNSGAGNSAGATSPSTGSNVTLAWAAAADWWGVTAVEVQHA